MLILVQSRLTRMDIPEKKDLRGAKLIGANFQGADFEQADLRGANFQGADLEMAHLKLTKLEQANFQGANLKRAHHLTIDQPSKLKTLYDRKLDDELLKKMKERYPVLFEKPDG
jgi:hypothetical protein